MEYGKSANSINIMMLAVLFLFPLHKNATDSKSFPHIIIRRAAYVSLLFFFLWLLSAFCSDLGGERPSPSKHHIHLFSGVFFSGFIPHHGRFWSLAGGCTWTVWEQRWDWGSKGKEQSRAPQNWPQGEPFAIRREEQRMWPQPRASVSETQIAS